MKLNIEQVSENVYSLLIGKDFLGHPSSNIVYYFNGKDKIIKEKG